MSGDNGNNVVTTPVEGDPSVVAQPTPTVMPLPSPQPISGGTGKGDGGGGEVVETPQPATPKGLAPEPVPQPTAQEVLISGSPALTRENIGYTPIRSEFVFNPLTNKSVAETPLAPVPQQGEDGVPSIQPRVPGTGDNPGWLDAVDPYLQPTQRDVNFQDTPFTSTPGLAIGAALPPGLGAVAALGGELSRANLERIYDNHGAYTTDSGLGVIPANTISGVTTPLAVSPGPVDGFTVISGNTDLAIQQNPGLDVNKDGQLTSVELQ